jgi:hypothetical protein
LSTLDNHQSQSTVKLLIVGNSGVGKTGALASLPPAGYRLFIIDFDNGLDILRDPTVLAPQFHSQVYFKTFTDPVNLAMPQLALPRAAMQAAAALNSWEETVDGKKISLGGVEKWGEKDVLVIDSLTFWGNALMRQVLAMNKRLGQQPFQSDWGDAIRMQEETIAALYSETIRCNIVIMAHLSPIEDKTAPGISRLYPSALGSKFPPKVGRYFNNMILMERKGDSRIFKTRGTAVIDLKTSKPSSIPPEMPANLAEFFRLARGK